MNIYKITYSGKREIEIGCDNSNDAFAIAKALKKDNEEFTAIKLIEE